MSEHTCDICSNDCGSTVIIFDKCGHKFDGRCYFNGKSECIICKPSTEVVSNLINVIGSLLNYLPEPLPCKFGNEELPITRDEYCCVVYLHKGNSFTKFCIFDDSRFAGLFESLPKDAVISQVIFHHMKTFNCPPACTLGKTPLHPTEEVFVKAMNEMYRTRLHAMDSGSNKN